MNKNEVRVNNEFKCAICGEIYETVKERTACETKCVAKVEADKKAALEAIKKAEKEACFTEASNAIDNAFTLVNKCVEDYGEFYYNGKLKNSKESIINYFPSRIWHKFFF